MIPLFKKKKKKKFFLEVSKAKLWKYFSKLQTADFAAVFLLALSLGWSQKYPPEPTSCMGDDITELQLSLLPIIFSAR